MLQSIPLQMQLDEAERLKGALEEPWQNAHRQAMCAVDWDYIVAKCLQLAEGLELGWEVTCRDAISGELENLRQREESLGALFEKTIEVSRKAHEKARAFARETGHSIEQLEELKSVIPELERRRDKYLCRLSLIDDAIIEEAKAEHAAGSYPSPAHALADLLAARHAERITPSYAELRAWADRSPPSPQWNVENENGS